MLQNLEFGGIVGTRWIIVTMRCRRSVKLFNMSGSDYQMATRQESIAGPIAPSLTRYTIDRVKYNHLQLLPTNTA